MYNPRGEQDISRHAFELLQLSPEEIRRQRQAIRGVRACRDWVEAVPLLLIESVGRRLCLPACHFIRGLQKYAVFEVLEDESGIRDHRRRAVEPGRCPKSHY